MKNSPYFHFLNLYKNSNESIICIDESLRIIYISQFFRSSYDFDVNDDVLLNCFIPNNFCVQITDAIKHQKAISFEFISLQDDLPKKCFVLPNVINNENFASLLITDNDRGIFESNQNKELKHFILSAESAIRDYTYSIISLLNEQTSGKTEELIDNPFFVNTMKIRKEIESLSVLARKDLRTKSAFLIDLTKYIKRQTAIIEKLLGRKRISFELDFKDGIVPTEMRYDIFDILFSNAISASISKQKGHAKLTVRVSSYNSAGIVTISDSVENCILAEEALKCAEKDSVSIGNPAIDKIISENKCKVIKIPNKNGGCSISFTLPPLPKRLETFRDEPYHNPEKDGFLSSLGVGIADILDK